MSVIDSLTARNAAFADSGFSPDLKIMPTKKTMILACVDPRADPVDIFGLEPGEAAVIRNVGGRVDPNTLRTMALLRGVVNVRSRGGDIGSDWNFIVLHHTDCGIGDCQLHAPDMLAKHMGTDVAGLDALAIRDPYAAVKLDIAALQANPNTPPGLNVTGMVYDVATGKVEVVVPTVVLHA
ncbi:carbonic anhydrase [Rugamonas sp.]|uniref:carbonic anhydrase n=1 Tax=Rugamonas sp. TaxID=1926287 RepID=UPI0025DC03F1|nr:carbonic anhydrase [Rugamonas sp.]